jgi:hypothetical protein
MNKLYIGISGFARSGKDLCGKIISNFLEVNGKIPLRVALADELKIDVEEFLNIKCNTSPYTDDTEEKTKIRPFLVWYGCYQRGRQPDYWIKQIEKTIDINPDFNVVVCTDIRFPNEAHWIHSKGGWLIHLSKYVKLSPDGGKTWQRKYQEPPNEEEAKNDPVVKGMADFKINWEDLSNSGQVKINMDDLVNNPYLKEEVFKSLKSYPQLSGLTNKNF